MLLFFVIVDVIFALNRDVNTFSNYEEAHIQTLHIEWLLDLDARIINCTAEYTFDVIKNGVKEIDLDIYQLNILVVYDHTSAMIIPH
jgi:leukotriene-A4 hydrolase